MDTDTFLQMAEAYASLGGVVQQQLRTLAYWKYGGFADLNRAAVSLIAERFGGFENDVARDITTCAKNWLDHHPA